MALFFPNVNIYICPAQQEEVCVAEEKRGQGNVSVYAKILCAVLTVVKKKKKIA